jgi:dTDP-glucose 4,6-dehydratase
LKPTRDFNFVKDTVNGFVSALFSDAGLGEVVNIGSNYEISIGETVNVISSLMGSEIEIISDEMRLRPEKSEVERLFSSNEKAKRLFGWYPQYAGHEGFKQGLKETIEWFSEPDNLVKYKCDLYNL